MYNMFMSLNPTTQEPQMKFNELLDNAAEPVSAYRKTIFKTILIVLCRRMSGARQQYFQKIHSSAYGKHHA